MSRTHLPAIDLDRLLGRLQALGRHGALPGGGVNRLALTDADRQGRDQVVDWMREANLGVTVDRIGNVIGVRAGGGGEAPVLVGSHIDTVATGGLFDGNLGVLAGLAVIEALDRVGAITRRPVAVGFFTNEEGARFAPDMMGSGVHQGALDLDTCLATRDRDGVSVAEALAGIGYAGETPVNSMRPACFLELHIEQGPVLEEAGVTIGAVTGVQGISWTCAACPIMPAPRPCGCARTPAWSPRRSPWRRAGWRWTWAATRLRRWARFACTRTWSTSSPTRRC